jgi:hypothetical protein
MKVRWPLLKFYLLLTILTIADCQIAHYKKIIVEDKDALCLDGNSIIICIILIKLIYIKYSFILIYFLLTELL